MRHSHVQRAAAALLCLTLTAAPLLHTSAEAPSDEAWLESLDAEALVTLRERINDRLRETGDYEFVRLAEGSRGDEVKALQERLLQLGYYTKTVDGQYQQATIRAMRAFEQAAGLQRDGIASPSDQKALFAANAPAAPTPSPAPKATRTPKPTKTPRVTNVPTPTKTPRPTRTPSLSKDYAKLDYRMMGLMPEKYLGCRYQLTGTILAPLNEGGRYLVQTDEKTANLIAVESLPVSPANGETLHIWGVYAGLITYVSETGPVTLPLLTCEHME